MSTLKEHDNILDNHEGRIRTLEESDIDKERRLKEMEHGFTKLENTIMTENRDTRKLLQDTLQNQWDIIKSRDKAEENDKKRKHEIEKTKMQNISETIMKFAGTGSVFYLILILVLKMLGVDIEPLIP